MVRTSTSSDKEIENIMIILIKNTVRNPQIIQKTRVEKSIVHTDGDGILTK